ncbi:MAG: hypothetical protein ACJ74J_12320 [Blastocatellia bacterium]
MRAAALRNRELNRIGSRVAECRKQRRVDWVLGIAAARLLRREPAVFADDGGEVLKRFRLEVAVDDFDLWRRGAPRIVDCAFSVGYNRLSPRGFVSLDSAMTCNSSAPLVKTSRPEDVNAKCIC